MTTTLVLFDIDGTLIHSGRAGLRALARAFDDLFGAPEAIHDVPFAGRTDRAIVGDGLRRAGREPGDQLIELVREAYCHHLSEEIERPVEHPKCVLPGVIAMLDALGPRDDIAVALLTGNFERGAAIKLGYFDLWTRFGFGAFGDAHTDRRALVPLAIERAHDRGITGLTPDRVIVVGDTPLDVDCAHAFGARALAVATGPYDADTLRATGAEVVVSNLSEWQDVWGTLTGQKA